MEVSNSVRTGRCGREESGTTYGALLGNKVVDYVVEELCDGVQSRGADCSTGIADTAERKSPVEQVVSPRSKATTSNPKDLFGEKKVSFTKTPGVAIAHCSHALMDGAEKYGPYNWRDKAVVAHIYVDAAMRHFEAWFEGQEVAEDSGVHHLGHAMACCAILLDAQETGNLVDDRPICGDPDLFDRVSKRLAKK